MKMSIRFKLICSFLLLLVMSSSLVWLVFIVNDNYIRTQQITILDDKAHTATNRLLDYFLSIKSQQLKLANSYSQSNPNQDQFILEAKRVIEEQPSVQYIALLSPSGRQLAAISNAGVIPTNTLSVELPSEPLNSALSNQPAYSKVFFNAGISPQINLFTPINDRNGAVIGVIKTQVELSILPEVLSQVNLGEAGKVYIVDREGQLIIHPDGSRIDHRQIINRPVIKKLLTSGYVALEPADHYYINEDNEQVVASSNLVTDLQWVLVAEQSTDVAFSQLHFTRNLLITALTIGFALLIIVALVVSNSIAQPIKDLTRLAQRLKRGKFDNHSLIKTGDELQDLSESFNEMAIQLEDRQHNLERSNRSLSLERDRQRVLLQSLSDGVVAIDIKGKITVFNRAAERITGYKAESMIGRDINAAMQLYDGEKLLAFQDYTSQSRKFKTYLLEHGLSINTDRGVIALSVQVDPIQMDDDKHKGWILAFMDITKEKEFEAMKLDFVSMAAHELRTPLTALRGYLSLLNEEAKDKLSEDEMRYLDRSFISANQLNSLVENLLNLSRVERGALKLSLNPMAIDDVIAGVIDNLSNIAREKDITLQFSQGKKSSVVIGDNFRIAEVITNLVANGINYTAPGGWVKVEVKVKDGMVVVAVHDNGQGIPASAIPHLFTKFYRVQSTLAMGSKGTGLGLYISKAIIEAHHGKIWVESVEGRGTTFYFSLPIAPKDAKPLLMGKAR